ncbi:MAG: nuclear transport factor 2 family protein [Akkermansiaceae bacterium]
MMRCLFLYLFFSAFTVATNAADEATDTSAKNFVLKWGQAFNKNDSKYISSFYDQDKRLDMLTSSGAWLKGYEAIEKSYRDDMKALKFSDSNIKNIQLRTYAKTALVSFEHQFKYRILSENVLWRIHIRTTMALRHTDKGWKIAMEHSSPLQGIERAVKVEE